MFTVEFESDSSIITSLDEQGEFDDVEMIIADDNVVFMRQWDDELQKYEMLIMRWQQLLDIAASLQSTQGLHKIEVVRNG